MKKLLVLSLFILLGVFLVSCDKSNEETNDNLSSNNSTATTEEKEEVDEEKLQLVIKDYESKADSFLRAVGIPSSEIITIKESCSYRYHCLTDYSRNEEEATKYFDELMYCYELEIVNYCYNNKIKIKTVHHQNILPLISTYNKCLDSPIYEGFQSQYDRELYELQEEVSKASQNVSYAKLYGGNVAKAQEALDKLLRQAKDLEASWKNKLAFDKAYNSLLNEIYKPLL